MLIKSTSPKNNDLKKSSKMVKCAKCQLYVPEEKAFQYQGQFYCCEAHAKYQ
jgi:ribosomal protein S26